MFAPTRTPKYAAIFVAAHHSSWLLPAVNPYLLKYLSRRRDCHRHSILSGNKEPSLQRQHQRMTIRAVTASVTAPLQRKGRQQRQQHPAWCITAAVVGDCACLFRYFIIFRRFTRKCIVPINLLLKLLYANRLSGIYFQLLLVPQTTWMVGGRAPHSTRPSWATFRTIRLSLGNLPHNTYIFSVERYHVCLYVIPSSSYMAYIRRSHRGHSR